MKSGVRGSATSSNVRNRQIQSAINHWFWGGGATDPIIETFGDDLFLYLKPSKLKSIFQEGNTTAQVTDGALAATVGLIYDQSQNAMKALATNAAFAPVLTTSGTMTGLSFNGTFRSLRVTNSKKFFSPIHAAAPIFELAFPIQASSDGVAAFVMGTTIGGANNGFYLLRTSANRFQFLTVDGGSAKTNYTTTFTLTVADGLSRLKIKCNGSGAGAGTITKVTEAGVETSETFTVVAGTSIDSSVDLAIGTRPNLDGTSNFNGFIGWIIGVNRVLTAGEWTMLKSYNPAVDSTEMDAILELEYDPQNGATMWADTARTTPATDGGALNAMDNNITSNFGLHNRNLNASAAGIYQTNFQNGYAAVEFNGVDTNFALAPYEDERGGKKIWLHIYKNLDATNGSHLMRGGSASIYGVQTGVNFGGGAGFPDYLFHTSTGDVSNEAPLLNDADEYTVVVERTNGSTTDVWTSANVKFSKTGLVGDHNYTQMGNEAIVGWQRHGPMLLTRKYNGHLTDAQVSSLISQFNTKYAIPAP